MHYSGHTSYADAAAAYGQAAGRKDIGPWTEQSMDYSQYETSAYATPDAWNHSAASYAQQGPTKSYGKYAGHGCASCTGHQQHGHHKAHSPRQHDGAACHKCYRYPCSCAMRRRWMPLVWVIVSLLIVAIVIAIVVAVSNGVNASRLSYDWAEGDEL